MVRSPATRSFVVLLCLGAFAACGDDRDDSAATVETDTLARASGAPSAPAQGETGTATVYAGSLQGGQTAAGEPFDHDQLIAAHRTHPMGTQLRVTNVANNQSVTVRVADRIPAGTDALVDLSRSAAQQLGIGEQGQAQVRVEVVN